MTAGWALPVYRVVRGFSKEVPSELKPEDGKEPDINRVERTAFQAERTVSANVLRQEIVSCNRKKLVWLEYRKQGGQ